MQRDRLIFIASLTIFVTGAIWGFYWLPVRYLETRGLTGPWGTAAIVASAILILAPFAIRARGQRVEANPMAIVWMMVGGVAFALYSISFIYGRVAIVALLFFLTPVWSTIIARYVLGVVTPAMRMLAILVGLLGLIVMLSANGDWPIPRTLGEWMGLGSGICWAIASTGMRETSDLAPSEAAFYFGIGSIITTLFFAVLLEPWPGAAMAADPWGTLGIAVIVGVVWWSLLIVAQLWATVQLDPARVGILMMAEVITGALSAALLAGEHLGPLEIVGGGFVILAAVLEVWPARRAPTL